MNTMTEVQSTNAAGQEIQAVERNRYLTTLRWLVKREFWENRYLFFWGPVGIALTICAVFLWSAFKDSPWGMHAKILDNKKIMQDDPLAAANFIRDFITTLVSQLPIVLQMFNFWMLCIGGFISVLYLMSALHTERVERSILFWKSLPTADSQTVLSKTIFPLFLLPFMLWMIATVLFFVSIFLFGVVSEFTSVNLFWSLMGSLDLYILSLKMISLLPFYAMWALPSVGWYLMVSAWAKSRVFPWVIGIPVLSIGLSLLLNHVFHLGWDIRWYSIQIVLRLIGGVFPASWLLEQQNIGLPEHYFSLENITQQAWLAMQGASIWIGALAGILMLFVAVRLRQFNESNT